MGRRIPVNLSPGQTLLLVGVLVAIVVALAALVLLDGVIVRIGGYLLRITGHQPPLKSSIRMAIDALDEPPGNPKA